MEKYSDIIQFSRDLFLHAYEEMPFPREEIDALDPPRFIRAAITTLDFFRDGFCSKFFKVYRKHLSDVMDTDEQFFRYVIPRCLKLVDDDNYFFSFMLVAAFICELIFHLTWRRDCFRFTGVAHKCLVAVYKRRFEETFEENGGWKGLRLYCEKISTFENTNYKTFGDILTDGDRAYKKQVFQRIKQCDILHCENFILNDYELLLITIDDQLAIDAEVNDFTAKTIDPPLEVEWTMVKDNECVKVCSRFDDESGTVISKFIPGSGAEPAAVPGSDAEPAAVPGSDAEPAAVPGSDAEPAAVPGSDAEPAAVPGSDAEPAAVPGSDAEPAAVRGSDAEPPAVPSSDAGSIADSKFSSDDDSSSDDAYSSESDEPEIPGLEELATDFFASTAVYHLHPNEFDQKKSARMCQWCNKKCFQYAKHFFIKHRELSLRPQKFRKTKYILTSSIKTIGKIFSKYF